MVAISLQRGWRLLQQAVLLQLLGRRCLAARLVAKCWGDASQGGNCVGLNLSGVTSVHRNWYAFVALRNGSDEALCWGHEEKGGNCTGRNFTGITHVYSTNHAFLALDKSAGTGFCWGHPNWGGNCTGRDFSGITDVYSTRYAFVAVDWNSGRAFCWGKQDDGGSCEGMNLTGFDEVFSTWGIFVALSRTTGQMKCWGSDGDYHGGPAPGACQNAGSSGVPRLYAAQHAVVALHEQAGKAVCWGHKPEAQCEQVNFAGVTKIHSTRYAFVALNEVTGEAQCWGDSSYGGACGGLNLSGMTDVFSSWYMFLAVNFTTGQHHCWGSSEAGKCQASDFTGITDVYRSQDALVAVDRHTGRMLCFGGSTICGACPNLTGSRIVDVQTTRYAVMALFLETGHGADEELLARLRVVHWIWWGGAGALLFIFGLIILWITHRGKPRWDGSKPIKPEVAKEVAKLRSRSGSWSEKSPKLASLLGKRAETLLARAALDAAGGPAYWGITVRQLKDFYEENRMALEAYCRDHGVTRDFQHVCFREDCPHFHGCVSYRPATTKEKAENELFPVEFNMHLVAQLIIKPQTMDNMGILGYWSTMNLVSPKKVQTFISHCWNQSFRGLVKAVGTLGPDTVVWICSFALPQNLDIGKVLGSDIMKSPFATALSCAENVCLTVDERVEALNRSWCCFELYLTVNKKIGLDIRAPITSTATYAKVLDRARSVDVRNCHASNPEDHSRILRVLKGMEDMVNLKVRQQVEQIVRLLLAHQRNLEDLELGMGGAARVVAAHRESEDMECKSRFELAEFSPSSPL